MLKMRGIDLPGWDDDVGMHTNIFWMEMLMREQRLEAAKLRFAAFSTYVMAGMPESVEVAQRADILNPIFDDVLSKVDHSAYTLEKRIHDAAVRVGQARARVKEIEQMKWITGDDFSVSDWMDFKDVTNGK